MERHFLGILVLPSRGIDALPPSQTQTGSSCFGEGKVLFPCPRFVLRISLTAIIQDYLPTSRSLTISVRSGISSWNLGGWEGHFSVSCPTLCICTSPLLSSLLKLTVRIKWCSCVGAFANKIPPALPFELSSFLLAWPACSTLKCPSRDYGCIQEWGEVRAAEWHRGMRNQTLLACAYGVCVCGVSFRRGRGCAGAGPYVASAIRHGSSLSFCKGSPTLNLQHLLIVSIRVSRGKGNNGIGKHLDHELGS